MRMNYFVVGTNDMEAAAAFYDALFEGAEVKQLRPSDRMIYWLGADFAFAVARPFDGNPATRGN
jgi:predicted enzyme related to lactoylglutathione lyase